MKLFGLLAIIVLALAISPNLVAQPKPVTLLYSMKEVMPAATKSITTTAIPERPGQSRRDPVREQSKTAAPAVGSIKAVSTSAQRQASQPVRLSLSQKQALVMAWQAGYHYGIPYTFAAVVYVESGGCQSLTGDHGLAFGCSQIHAHAAYLATGVHLPTWMLSDPSMQDMNMAVGARYLKLCLDKFGWPAGVGCYNHGLHTHLTRHQLSHLRYTRAVLAAMQWLRQLPLSED